MEYSDLMWTPELHSEFFALFYDTIIVQNSAHVSWVICALSDSVSCKYQWNIQQATQVNTFIKILSYLEWGQYWDQYTLVNKLIDVKWEVTSSKLQRASKRWWVTKGWELISSIYQPLRILVISTLICEFVQEAQRHFQNSRGQIICSQTLRVSVQRKIWGKC